MVSGKMVLPHIKNTTHPVEKTPNYYFRNGNRNRKAVSLLYPFLFSISGDREFIQHFIRNNPNGAFFL
jgi:hypothetical protein